MSFKSQSRTQSPKTQCTKLICKPEGDKKKFQFIGIIVCGAALLVGTVAFFLIRHKLRKAWEAQRLQISNKRKEEFAKRVKQELEAEERIAAAEEVLKDTQKVKNKSPEKVAKPVKKPETKAETKSAIKKKPTPPKKQTKSAFSDSDSETSRFKEMMELDQVLSEDQMRALKKQPRNGSGLFGLFDTIREVLEKNTRVKSTENDTVKLAQSLNDAVQDVVGMMTSSRLPEEPRVVEIIEETAEEATQLPFAQITWDTDVLNNSFVQRLNEEGTSEVRLVHQNGDLDFVLDETFEEEDGEIEVLSDASLKVDSDNEDVEQNTEDVELIVEANQEDQDEHEPETKDLEEETDEQDSTQEISEHSEEDENAIAVNMLGQSLYDQSVFLI